MTKSPSRQGDLFENLEISRAPEQVIFPISETDEPDNQSGDLEQQGQLQLDDLQTITLRS